ncbi:MAG: hypothetical protein ACUVQ8_07955 [Nitrososphaeria archaeon]
MNNKDDRCHGDYIPWERKLKPEDLEKKIVSIGPDEGIRINGISVGGERVKVFINKTGLEHAITIAYDDCKEQVYMYQSGLEAYRSLNNLMKDIREIVLY